METTPIATLLCKQSAPSFSYLIDSGAEESIIKHSVTKTLNATIKTDDKTHVFSGFGSQIVYAVGVCDLITVLPMVTLDIRYAVVPDSVIPDNIDLIIGWDVISRPCLRIEKGHDGLELHHDLLSISKVLTLKSVNSVKLHQPDLPKGK